MTDIDATHTSTGSIVYKEKEKRDDDTAKYYHCMLQNTLFFFLYCLGLIMKSVYSFRRFNSYRYNLYVNNLRNSHKLYLNQKSTREYSSSDILRRGNDTNYAAQWQSKGDLYLSLDKLDLLNRKLMSYDNSLTRKEKGELLRDVSLIYFARFHDLIRKEYQFEKKAVEERLKKWSLGKLKSEGLTIFDLKPSFQGALFQDHIIRFDWGRDKELPYNKFANGDSVRITLKGKNPLNNNDFVDGVVLRKGRKYINVCVRAVDLINIQKGRKYRLDASVNRISYDRMLDSLQLFLRSELGNGDSSDSRDSRDSNNKSNKNNKISRVVRDLILYSYPNSLVRLSLGGQGLRLGLPVNETILRSNIRKKFFPSGTIIPEEAVEEEVAEEIVAEKVSEGESTWTPISPLAEIDDEDEIDNEDALNAFEASLGTTDEDDIDEVEPQEDKNRLRLSDSISDLDESATLTQTISYTNTNIDIDPDSHDDMKPRALTVSEALAQAYDTDAKADPFAPAATIDDPTERLASLFQSQALSSEKKSKAKASLAKAQVSKLLRPFRQVFRTNERLDRMKDASLVSEYYNKRAFEPLEIERALRIVQSRGRRDVETIDPTLFTNSSTNSGVAFKNFLESVVGESYGGNSDETIKNEKTEREYTFTPNEMNESQQKALYEAISKPISLIQGPPGTGKTRTSCNILATLIELRDQRLKMGGKTSQGLKSYKVLACAHSNVATDNLLRGLLEVGVNVIRLGRPSSIQSSLWAHTLDARVQQHPTYLSWKSRLTYMQSQLDAEMSNGISMDESIYAGRVRALLKRLQKIEKDAALAVLREADVVVTTCIGAGSETLKSFTDSEDFRFSTVLVDEAAQCVESAVLPTLVHGCDQLILVGDQNQLPPVVVSPVAADDGLGISLFARLVAAGMRPNLLEEQYRMHEKIAEFSSNRFYGGAIKNGVSSHHRIRPGGFNWPTDNVPVAFLQCLPESVTTALNYDTTTTNSSGKENGIFELEGGAGTSYSNDAEASSVIATIRSLLKDPSITLDDIGVISPYNGQVRVISERAVEEGWINDINPSPMSANKLLKLNNTNTNSNVNSNVNGNREGPIGQLEVRSVDGFQGREKEVIIITTVRSNPKNNVGFLVDWRRLNVAITRAKRGLIVIGDSNTLKADNHWTEFINWCKDHDAIRCLHGNDDELSSYIDESVNDSWEEDLKSMKILRNNRVVSAD